MHEERHGRDDLAAARERRAYVGQRLAQRLGYRYVDREILTRAAATLGLEDERSLEHLEEQAPHWWDHIARVIGVGPPA